MRLVTPKTERNDGSVKDDHQWALEMKNNQEQARTSNGKSKNKQEQLTEI